MRRQQTDTNSKSHEKATDRPTDTNKKKHEKTKDRPTDISRQSHEKLKTDRHKQTET